ncbi:hypothetical protein MTO96_020630 [Rhipicephalus appendiculatus]
MMLAFEREDYYRFEDADVFLHVRNVIDLLSRPPPKPPQRWIVRRSRTPTVVCVCACSAGHDNHPQDGNRLERALHAKGMVAEPSKYPLSHLFSPLHRGGPSWASRHDKGGSRMGGS